MQQKVKKNLNKVRAICQVSLKVKWNKNVAVTNFLTLILLLNFHIIII